MQLTKKKRWIAVDDKEKIDRSGAGIKKIHSGKCAVSVDFSVL